MVKISHTKGFYRRAGVMAVSMLIIAAGLGALGWGYNRSQMEGSGGGPVVYRSSVTTEDLVAIGDHLALVGSDRIDVYDSEVNLLHQVGPLSGPIRTAMVRASDGYIVTDDGVLEILTGETHAYQWPDDFSPKAVSWPYAYGVNETQVMVLDLSKINSEAFGLDWGPEQTIIGNRTKFLSVQGERVALEILLENPSGGSLESQWLVWNVDDDVASVVPLPDDEEFPGPGWIGFPSPIALTDEGIMVLSESSLRPAVRAYDMEHELRWTIYLDPELVYTSVLASSGLWVVNFETEAAIIYGSVGFVYGDHSGLVLGERRTKDGFMNIKHGSAWPVGDHIAFVENHRLVVTDPHGGWSPFTYAVLALGFLLTILGALSPSLFQWIVGRDQKKGIRCLECGTTVQGNESGFCFDCGREIPKNGDMGQ